MSLLVRKIDKAKWQQNNVKEGENPSADAITQCLRTTQNTLSVWRIHEEAELNEAIVAMAAAFDHLDSIDVALLDEVALLEQEITLVESPGLTPFKEMRENHRDLSELNYKKLGAVAGAIVNCFKDKTKLIRYTRTGLQKLLKTAVQDGKIHSDELKEHVRSKIEE